MRSSMKGLALLAGLLGGLAATQPAFSEPVKLRLGWVVIPAELEPLLPMKPDLAAHLGKTYTLDAVHFNGTTPMIGALASGDLDVAGLAYSSFSLAVENAGMSDLRAICDEIQDGVPGYNTNSFMVRKDSPIKTVQDLKGKVLASNTVGSAIDMAMRAMLRKSHLDPKTDVTIIESAFGTMRAMLSDRKVDLVSTPLPFWRDPSLAEFARPLFTQKDAMGQTQMIVLAGRSGVLKKKHDAIVDLLEDSLRLRRFLHDPAHHEEAVALVEKATKQPRDKFASWIFTKQDYYRDPSGMPNLEALQNNIKTQHELGFLKTTIDIHKFVDLGLVKTAASRLKGR